MYAANFLKLPKGVKIPTLEELKRKLYCKWLNSWSHLIKNCIIFRDRIQEQIWKGRLKFLAKSEKAMGIDTNPFPEIGEAAGNVGMLDFQNISLKELEEVTIQMHVDNQTAFRKNIRSSPVNRQSS